MARKPFYLRLFWMAIVVLLVALPAWRRSDIPARYGIGMEEFKAKTEAMVAAFATGREEGGIPVIHPPEGDVYLMAHQFGWYPVLEMEVGRTYRLHVLSEDVMHGFAVTFDHGAERLLMPNQAEIVSLRPTVPGHYQIICADYCGIEHNSMRAPLIVTPRR
ncbi:MAG: quinol oxidase [Alphaproteobacteria bacterium]|nr:quinol oxidase [Alphaproteobacteria bacterium]